MRPALLHIATFGAHDVYLGADKKWAVKTGPHWSDTLVLHAKDSLLWLPLLEHDYQQVHAGLLTGLRHVSPERAAHLLATFPVQNLLRIALLGGGSAYWVELALGWAAHLALAPDLRRAVQALASDLTVPQPTRQRAKRLYYTNNR